MSEAQADVFVKPMPKWPVPVLFGGIAAVIAIFIYLSGSGLRACEDEIKSTLKAPATYARISADGTSGIYSITYDAANSFGVPIRSSGICSVTDNRALWVETGQQNTAP